MGALFVQITVKDLALRARELSNIIKVSGGSGEALREEGALFGIFCLLYPLSEMVLSFLSSRWLLSQSSRPSLNIRSTAESFALPPPPVSFFPLLTFPFPASVEVTLPSSGLLVNHMYTYLKMN